MPASQSSSAPRHSARGAVSSEAPDREQRGSLSLDQWRGLALVLVLISHGFFFTGRVNGIGRVGVNLFFFISGILVYRSISRSKSPPFENACLFWWRRFKRLYPALLAYILATLLGTWLFQSRPNLPLYSDFSNYLKAIPFAVSYLINYKIEGPMSLGHLWSLSCEMQFYLLTPIIYMAFGTTHRGRSLGFSSLLGILVFLGMAQPFIGKWKYHFEFAVWPMMAGFWCEHSRNWLRRFPERLVTPVLRGSVAICAIILVLTLFGYEMKLAVIGIGALLLAPCWLAYIFGRPMPAQIGRLMQWLGERTYSVYLWQQPFTICNYLPSFLHPGGAILSIGVGALWFKFFEQPFLSQRRRQKISN